jgi:hypothetical protein
MAPDELQIGSGDKEALDEGNERFGLEKKRMIH